MSPRPRSRRRFRHYGRDLHVPGPELRTRRGMISRDDNGMVADRNAVTQRHGRGGIHETEGC